MALAKYGAIVSELRGKEGGIVFSRNSYGGYVKQKVSPINPQTRYQQEVRAQLGTIAQQWSGLPDALKQDWKQLGQQVLRVNRFGDQTYYTGFSIFVKLNRNRTILGQSIIDTPPVIPTIPTLTLTNLEAIVTDGRLTTLALSYTATGGSALTDYRLAIDATPPINTGRRFVKNFYRQLGAIQLSVSPIDILASYVARYGAEVTLGSYIGIRGRLIHLASGMDGPFAVVGTITTGI